MEINTAEILDMILNPNRKKCPFFRDPPVSDADVAFISRYWSVCDFDDICLDKAILSSFTNRAVISEIKTNKEGVVNAVPIL